MKSMTKPRFGAAQLLASLGLFVLATCSVPAVLLGSGDAAFLTGTTVADRPELAGTVIYDVLRPITVFNTATNDLVWMGNLQDRVVREDGTGTLDFYYRLRDDAGVLDANGAPLPGKIGLVAVSNFAGYTTDVDYRTDGDGNVGPDLAISDGNTIGFYFLNNDGLSADLESLFFFVKTNATAFNTAGNVFEIDFGNGLTATVNTAQPAVPEPATLSLLGLGLAGVGAMRRRMKRA